MMQIFRWMVSIVVVVSAAVAHAQEKGSWSVVTADDTKVYSGRGSDSFYYFYRLRKSELVWVVNEKDGWAQVRPTGPAFGEAFGYVKADQRIQLSADGKKGKITAKTDLIAPNSEAKGSVDSSWKQLARLNPDDEVTIYATVAGSRDTMYKIALPGTAEAYVNMAFLRPASAEEVASYEAMIAKSTGQKVETPPATPSQPKSEEPKKPDESKPDSSKRDGQAPAPVKEPETSTKKPEIVPVEPTEPTSTPPAATAPASTDAPAIVEPKPREKRLEEVTLSDLESALKDLDKQARLQQEVGPLRERYAEYAARPTTSMAQKKYAESRVAQLEVRMEAQKRLFEIEELRAKNNREKEGVEAALLRIQARADYVAVGRLNASTIYDGRRLPLLYRVQDDGTGQTVAYMRPGSSFDLTGMLGQLIGIVGQKNYDGALRVNLITPDRIDVLGPRDATKEPPAN